MYFVAVSLLIVGLLIFGLNSGLKSRTGISPIALLLEFSKALLKDLALFILGKQTPPAEIVGKSLKITFQFRGGEYCLFVPYNDNFPSEKVVVSFSKRRVESRTFHLDGLPLLISPADLTVSNVSVHRGSKKRIFSGNLKMEYP